MSGEEQEKARIRFLSKIEKTDSCWLWKTRRNEHGYGTFFFKPKAGLRGANILAHRFSWMIFNGPIPEGMSICHRCDVPACVNPSHLFLGTHMDNMRDRDSKGRSKSNYGECNPRARLTEASVIEIRAKVRNTLAERQRAAETYGVSESSIWSVLRGRTWKQT